MNVNKLCLCCNTESSFYQNSVTGKVATYCLECNSKFSPAQKKLKETNQLSVNRLGESFIGYKENL